MNLMFCIDCKTTKTATLDRVCAECSNKRFLEAGGSLVPIAAEKQCRGGVHRCVCGKFEGKEVLVWQETKG